MKNRVINIFLKLMAVAVASVTLSCSKVEITSRMYEPEYFCSAYSDGVSTYYYMNCYISNVVNVNFFKKEMVKIGETTVVIIIKSVFIIRRLFGGKISTSSGATSIMRCSIAC